jgi:hypothetical protein|tara:strand:+ start:307 stop:468 length:162 start_codon:yes stop_codon:yes gene_type:complete
MKKSVTFNDFNILILKGKQRFLTFAEFTLKNFGSTRAKRRKMIKYHYKNIFDL